MTAQPNPYLGDLNMFLDLTDFQFNAHNGKIHDRIIDENGGTGGEKLIYLGALLAKSKSDLLKNYKIGPVTVLEINSFLKNLSKETGREYKLRDDNTPRYEGTQHISSCVKDSKLIDAYGLPKDMKPLTEFVVHYPQTEQQKSIQGFCALEFAVVSESADDGVIRIDMKLPQIFGDLIKDQHLYLDNVTRKNNDSEEHDEEVIHAETHATETRYALDGSSITLIYDPDLSGINRLATLGMHPSRAMANAANILMPIGQEAH